MVSANTFYYPDQGHHQETNQMFHHSRGDGDFGKLGRGGSEGCFIPQPIERLIDVGVIQIECGAQFSLALTKAGEIWTWGKVSHQTTFIK